MARLFLDILHVCAYYSVPSDIRLTVKINVYMPLDNYQNTYVPIYRTKLVVGPVTINVPS